MTFSRVTIHSFGLGLTHKPDTMIELSTRTKASYTYVKDWMMLRECVAGSLGSLQTISHQNVKLKLRLPEGSPAKFVKISGALQITKRATGKDAEAALGDLRFGDKRGKSAVGLSTCISAANIGQIFSSSWPSRPTTARQSTSLRILGKLLFLDSRHSEARLTRMTSAV